MNFYDRKISKISSTFNNDGIINFLLSYQVVMPSQNKINSRDLFSELDVIILHHMSKSYYHITFFFLSQFLNHFISKLNERNIFTYLFIVWIKRIYPLFFGQAEDSYFNAIFVNNVGL